MSGRMSVGWKAHHSSISKHVMLTSDELPTLADIKVLLGKVSVGQGHCMVPFDALHHKVRIGYLGVSTGMVIVQVRIDQVRYLTRINVHRRQAR